MNEAHPLSSKRWFRALIRGAHRGAGHCLERVIYIYARNTSEALSILKQRARGLQRTKNVIALTVTSPEETHEVEQWIRRNLSIPLHKVKRTGWLASIPRGVAAGPPCSSFRFRRNMSEQRTDETTER